MRVFEFCAISFSQDIMFGGGGELGHIFFFLKHFF